MRPLSSPSDVSITPGLQSPIPCSTEAAKSGDPEPPPLALESDDIGSSTTPKGRSAKLPSMDDGARNRGITDSGNRDTNGRATLSSGEVDGANDITSSSANEDRPGTSSAASTLRPRLPRIQIQSYLGLAPLSSMWRGRGASSSSEASSSKNEGAGYVDAREEIPETSTAQPEGDTLDNSSEENSATSEDVDEDEDDRRTVRGSSVPTTPVADARSRRGSIAPDSLLDNLKDLKARVHLRGGSNALVGSEAEKSLERTEDRDTVVDTPLQLDRLWE